MNMSEMLKEKISAILNGSKEQLDQAIEFKDSDYEASISEIKKTQWRLDSAIILLKRLSGDKCISPWFLS